MSGAAWLTLAILLLFFLLSFVDKQMISLLVNPIGQSLALDDAQLGLLIGAAFGIFYTLSVLGGSWLLDRYSKKLLLFLAVLGWSLAAAGTGLARSFGELFVARALVGIGEGFLPPAAFALIALVFPRRRVAMATGIFFAGSSLGSVVALLAGGKVIAALNASGGLTFPLVGHLEAWRSAFLLSALPGVPLALLAFLLHTRPRPGTAHGPAALAAEDYWPFLKRRRALLLRHNLAFGMSSAACYAVLLWAPAYLERAFGWGADRVGMTLALGSGVGAVANVVWGMVADRLKKRGYQDGLYRLFAVLFLLCIPTAILTFTTLGPATFLIGYLAMSALLLGSGGLTAAMQLATPPNLRARIVSFQTLASGLFGLALAPALVPSLAQYVFRDRQAIGLSIATVVTITLLVAVALQVWARRPLRDAINEQEGLATER